MSSAFINNVGEYHLQSLAVVVDKGKPGIGNRPIARQRSDSTSGGAAGAASVVKTCAYLAEMYKDLPLTAAYGPKQVSHVARFSASYVFAVAPPAMLLRDTRATETLALFLSFVWVVDGVFDTHRATTTQADEDAFHAVLVGGHPLDPVSHVPSDPLVATLLTDVRALYDTYYARVAPYIERNPAAWALQQKWFSNYLRTLTDEPPFAREAEYRTHRLHTGAMMCVAAHLLLFTDSGAAHEEQWIDVALATSYHNDLFSLDRDIKQQTANVVTVRAQETGDSLWATFKWADGMVRAMEARISANTQGCDPRAHALMVGVTKGSRAWHKREPRYAVGASLLAALKKDDWATFYATVAPENETTMTATTPGDPTC